MAKRTLAALGSLILLSIGASAGHAEEMLLYTPKPATSEQAPASPREGVLVRTVTVQRGDTLGKISRKQIGVADYFPQMLVFNSIKDPDLIHPGDKLLVPVRPERTAKAKKSHVSGYHRAARKRAEKAVAAAPVAPHPVKAGERELFQRAQRSYLEHDYREALAGFNNFLHKFPHSTFAADASLYRADCFLHLSGE